MTMSSACARTRRSFNAVIPATNNLLSTQRLLISGNAYYPFSPSWFSPRTDIASVSGTGTRHNWRHFQLSSFPQIRQKPLLRCF